MKGAFEVGSVGEGVGRVGVRGRTGCGTGCDEGEVGMREERAGGVGAERDCANEEERTEETGPGRGWMGGGEETGGAANASEEEGGRKHERLGNITASWASLGRIRAELEFTHVSGES